MRSRLFVWLALAAGVALPGASTLSAQDWRGAFQDHRDLRNDYRDIANDRRILDRMRADIARDQARLNEAIRHGRPGEAARLRADLARDQRALAARMRDIQHDRRDAGRDDRGARDARYAYR